MSREIKDHLGCKEVDSWIIDASFAGELVVIKHLDRFGISLTPDLDYTLDFEQDTELDAQY